MRISVLYIDDELGRPHRDAQKIKELLEIPRKFQVDLQPPPRNFVDIQSKIPDALLVDYDLGTKPADGDPVERLMLLVVPEQLR